MKAFLDERPGSLTYTVDKLIEKFYEEEGKIRHGILIYSEGKEFTSNRLSEG